MVKTQYRVDIIESEKGYGQRLDSSRYFETVELANEFITEYNKPHFSISGVPDWYMIAKGPYSITYETKPIKKKTLRRKPTKITKFRPPKMSKGGTNPPNTSTKRPPKPCTSNGLEANWGYYDYSNDEYIDEDRPY